MTLVQAVQVHDVTPIAGVPEGAPAGSVPGGADSAGRSSGSTSPAPFTLPDIRSFTMFQALYADLARAHRKRRQREFQRQLEARAQHEMLVHAAHMLAR